MHFVVVTEFLYIDYTTKSFKNPSFFSNKKALQVKAKGLVIVLAPPPLLASFRTFKGNIAIENVRLNQLIIQY
jgi:hypothetical protein